MGAKRARVGGSHSVCIQTCVAAGVAGKRYAHYGGVWSKARYLEGYGPEKNYGKSGCVFGYYILPSVSRKNVE